MDESKTVNLTDTLANLVKGVHHQVSVDQSKRAAMLPQLHLLIEKFCKEVQIGLVSERGNESDCELILSSVGQFFLNLVQSMLLHYNIRLLSF